MAEESKLITSALEWTTLAPWLTGPLAPPFSEESLTLVSWWWRPSLWTMSRENILHRPSERPAWFWRSASVSLSASSSWRQPPADYWWCPPPPPSWETRGHTDTGTSCKSTRSHDHATGSRNTRFSFQVKVWCEATFSLSLVVQSLALPLQLAKAETPWASRRWKHLWWSSPDSGQAGREHLSLTQLSRLTATSGCWQSKPEEKQSTTSITTPNKSFFWVHLQCLLPVGIQQFTSSKLRSSSSTSDCFFTRLFFVSCLFTFGFTIVT